jgi:hypothetical protein
MLLAPHTDWRRTPHTSMWLAPHTDWRRTPHTSMLLAPHTDRRRTPHTSTLSLDRVSRRRRTPTGPAHRLGAARLTCRCCWRPTRRDHGHTSILLAPTPTGGARQHASHVDVVGAPHRLGRPRVARVVGHAVQVLLQLVQDLPLACRVRLFVCVCARARRTARQPAAPRGADPFTREADGDRNAELSNADKSFADRRVTGDPPCSSPRRRAASHERQSLWKDLPLACRAALQPVAPPKPSSAGLRHT